MVEATRLDDINQLEEMTEAELEQEISTNNNNLARLTLGRLLIEGMSEKIPRNELKGENWVKELVKKNYLPAVEYSTYRDILIKKDPNLKKIMKSLETLAT